MLLVVALAKLHSLRGALPGLYPIASGFLDRDERGYLQNVEVTLTGLI
jgi:hypothetical protein